MRDMDAITHPAPVAPDRHRSGDPLIRGTRLSVEFVLDLLASGMSEAEILEDYSHITQADIQACLRYAARAFKNEVYLELEPLTA
ncbi:MAG: DUF433 domain-containing protein [Caldilineaceae bacterium]